MMIHLVNFSTLLGGGRLTGLEFESVFARGKDLLYSSALLAFSAVILYHGLYGLRNIVLEAVSGERTERIISWLIFTIGVLIFLYAAYGIILFYIL